ncbi:MAG: hypothetical protein V1836_02875 [Candidatus Aenigmatarchaeota archaeon]
MDTIRVSCPFCNKEISVYYKPSIFQADKSHSAAAGTKTSFFKTKEKYEVLEDCPNCHKSKKEIQKALEQGVSKPKSKEELKRQLEELGLMKKFGGETE